MMMGGFPQAYIGHIGRVPVFISADIIFLLLMGLYATAGIVSFLIFVGVVFFSVLMHELGHAITATAQGMGNIRIIVGGLGGLCHFTGDPHPKANFLISISGPIMNGLLVWASWLILKHVPIEDPVLWEALSWLFRINLFLGIFNALPIYPMDGGQATLALLSLRRGGVYAARRMMLPISLMGCGIAVTLSVLAFGGISGLTIGVLIYCLLSCFRDLR